MNTTDKNHLVLGIDYGTDSCRAIVADGQTGGQLASAVSLYPRWKEGRYCDPANNVFRQSPLDYIESLTAVMDSLLAELGTDVLRAIKGIAIDTTGSTPCAVDEHNVPLSMKPDFADDPDAMFILWKDHSSMEEAARINSLAKTWGGTDYTQYEGGIYSSEWFWAKIMHLLSKNPRLRPAAYSFVEHCDWMPSLLCGVARVQDIKRSRCAMGHKAMWHASFGGYPEAAFLTLLDQDLPRIAETLGTETWTSDTTFGSITPEWADKLHVRAGVPVAVGAFDAHMGAVGGGAEESVLVKVMGTSTCDMIVGSAPDRRVEQPPASVTGASTMSGQGASPGCGQNASPGAGAHGGGEHLVRGICGQVHGSIVPGTIGYEAGQSAFGDVYAWFKSILMWSVNSVMPDCDSADNAAKSRLREEIDKKLMEKLEKEAALIEPAESTVLALDWFNGRRTPDADPRLKSALAGLTLGVSAPALYRALIEGTAFGARAIVERFKQEGVAIDKVVAIGGIPHKSGLVMQIVADVLEMPIEIPSSEQTVALGTAMFASVVGGINRNIAEAQNAMKSPIWRTVKPQKQNRDVYRKKYSEYLRLGAFVEKETP